MYSLNPVEQGYPKLHIHIMEVLFGHQGQISKKLSDIKGLFFIDHIAVTIVNPKNEILIFSSTPSVEFNLIIHGLWKFDMSFNPMFHSEGKILFWEDAYLNTYKKEIKAMKETAHNFALGFNVSRKTEDFHLIYSFATRQNKTGLYEFYSTLIHELTTLGDYAYKLLRDIYCQYVDKQTPPIINTENSLFDKKCHLRLIEGNYDI